MLNQNILLNNQIILQNNENQSFGVERPLRINPSINNVFFSFNSFVPSFIHSFSCFLVCLLIILVRSVHSCLFHVSLFVYINRPTYIESQLATFNSSGLLTSVCLQPHLTIMIVNRKAKKLKS